MGRAIDMENKLQTLEQRIKLVEDALEEISRELVNTTKVHHVDLTDTRDVVAEGVEVMPDKDFLPPAGRRKSTPKTKAGKPKTVESLL